MSELSDRLDPQPDLEPLPPLDEIDPTELLYRTTLELIAIRALLAAPPRRGARRRFSIPVDVATATTHELVPGQPGRRIRVLGFTLIAGGAGPVIGEFRSGDREQIWGPLDLAARGGAVAPIVDGSEAPPWFETRAGQALSLNLSAAIRTGGGVVVEIEPPTRP